MFAIFTLSGCSSKVETSMINHKKGDAKIYFYRDAGDSKLSATIFVNRRLTGILLPNEYIKTDVCYGKVPVNIKTKIGNRLISNNITLDVKQDNNATTLYVRLYDTSSGVKAQNVMPDEEILDSKHYGENAINRYIPRCPNRR